MLGARKLKTRKHIARHHHSNFYIAIIIITNYEDKFFGILVQTQVMLSKELASSQLQDLKINKSKKRPKLFHLNLIHMVRIVKEMLAVVSLCFYRR